jgi:hypothetical protein
MREIMNNALLRFFFTIAGLAFIFTLALSAFPCTPCDDACCGSETASDMISCQCSCGFQGLGGDVVQIEHGMHVTGLLGNPDPPQAYDAVTRQLYRPPELVIL